MHRWLIPSLIACMSAIFSIHVRVTYARLRQREAASATAIRMGRKSKKIRAASLRVLQKVELDVARRYRDDTHQRQQHDEQQQASTATDDTVGPTILAASSSTTKPVPIGTCGSSRVAGSVVVNTSVVRNAAAVGPVVASNVPIIITSKHERIVRA
jgi:hypothetical protein